MGQLALVVAVVCAACYAPHAQPGSPCASGVCPTGLVCSPATGTCETTAEPAPDARTDDAPRGDAPTVDAMTQDAPLADAAATQPVLLQQATAHVDTGSTVSATFATLPPSGDVLVIVGGNPMNGLDTPSGGGVVTWMRLARSTLNVNIDVWIGLTNGTNATVTISLTGANAPNTLWVGDWSGLTTTNDGSSANAGSTSPASAATLTLPNQRDLVLFGVADGMGNTFGTPTPGQWTMTTPIIGNFVTQTVWYTTGSGAQTFDPTVAETSHNWDAAIVAIRIAP